MNIQCSVRGGAKNLAQHLLKDENDHVHVYDLRGCVSDELEPALNEMYAISRGTKARKFMFSISLNPPENENVPTEAFLEAIKRVEAEFDLDGQARAIVFHEKNARRHCHVVWSRIDTAAMKAIPMDFFKNRIKGISRDLYIEHGWTMPVGYIRSNERDPNNFTLAQWQEAKRNGRNPKETKTTIRDCWAASDTQSTFVTALKEQGYVLALGRRGAVVVDKHCQVFAVARTVGIQAKEVRARIKLEEKLSNVEDAKVHIAQHMASRLAHLGEESDKAIDARQSAIEKEKLKLKEKQRFERKKQNAFHDKRTQEETIKRQQRFNKGLRGVLDFFTGKRRQIAKQNEKEAANSAIRDQKEKDSLIFKQLEQSRKLKARSDRLKGFQEQKQRSIADDLDQFQEIQRGERDKFKAKRETGRRSPSIEH